MTTRPSAKSIRPLAEHDDDQHLVGGGLSGFDASAEAIYVAPNWKLVWWRFRKHRLAVFCGIVMLIIVTIALVPGFFSTQPPEQIDSLRTFIPPQRLHFLGADGFGPFVYDITGQRNPTTLMMEWVPDESKPIPIGFFVRGYDYEIIGLIPTNIHLVGVSDPAISSPVHFLGTDRLGRDQWSRLMYGTQVSLSIGLIGVAISFSIGLIFGGISGYYGGWIDNVLMRVAEMVMMVPGFYLLLALRAAVPPEFSSVQVYIAIVVILSFIGWAGLARIIRGMCLSLREREFVLAAKSIGLSDFSIIIRHILPHTLSYSIFAVMLSIPGYILGESALSLLGLGIEDPYSSWGLLLADAMSIVKIRFYPWILIPAFFIFLTIISFNVIGDALRDALDPMMKAEGQRS